MQLHLIRTLIFCIVIYSVIILLYITSYREDKIVKLNTSTERVMTNTEMPKGKINETMKYILQWTSRENTPFVDMGKGQNGFFKRKCPHVNCYVTDSRYHLGDYTNFDAIVFAGPDLVNSEDDIVLPERRSPHQKYVFASIESADYYKVCSKKYNGFFNWTWTYKLDSDVKWGYIVIRDKDYKIIGPKKDMNWMKLEDMDPVSEKFKMKLKSKKKAVAWFVSTCYTKRRREMFMRDFETELSKYQHVVDVYGHCRTLTCPRYKRKVCDKKISDNYYFYLSFENSFSEDYVTEKLLRALNNNAVPIVFGGANYTRFMPDGIYLNARELGAKNLAKKVQDLISDPEKYAEYFRWKSHYTYHATTRSVETNEYCKMCELLNDEEAMNKTTVYEDFQQWWDPPQACWQD